MINVQESKRLSFKSYANRALSAALLAVVINVILFYIGNAAGVS